MNKSVLLCVPHTKTIDQDWKTLINALEANEFVLMETDVNTLLEIIVVVQIIRHGGQPYDVMIVDSLNDELIIEELQSLNIPTIRVVQKISEPIFRNEHQICRPIEEKELISLVNQVAQ
jgi:ribosomal protein S2